MEPAPSFSCDSKKTEASDVSGTLYVVGTPIGNLGDLTPRARETLAAVAAIACEDTRRTGLLLSKHDIANPGMIVTNEHSERQAAEQVVERLAAGDDVAVVSDAGMPTISDPGAVVVAAAAGAGFDVVVVPGPSAVSAALAISGFVAGRFSFEGFLPRKGRERGQRLAALADDDRMLVLYEAPHRLERTLADLSEALGVERGVVVAHELTKLHESAWRGPLGEAGAAHANPKGEYVIVVDAPPTADPASDEELTAELAELLGAGETVKSASAEVAERHGVAKRRVYDLALAVRNNTHRG